MTKPVMGQSLARVLAFVAPVLFSRCALAQASTRRLMDSEPAQGWLAATFGRM